MKRKCQYNIRTFRTAWLNMTLDSYLSPKKDTSFNSFATFIIAWKSILGCLTDCLWMIMWSPFVTLNKLIISYTVPFNSMYKSRIENIYIFPSMICWVLISASKCNNMCILFNQLGHGYRFYSFPYDACFFLYPYFILSIQA